MVKLATKLITIHLSLFSLHVTGKTLVEERKKHGVADIVCINSGSLGCSMKIEDNNEGNTEDTEEEEVDEVDDNLNEKDDGKPYNKYVLSPCSDLDTKCEFWRDQGYCNDESKQFMLQMCQKSCDVCLDMEELTDCTKDDDDECDCYDFEDTCNEDAFYGKCITNAEYMEENCPVSCGHCLPYFDIGVIQNLIDSDQNELTILQSVRKIHTYFLGEVMIDPRYARVRHLCKNYYSECTIWAAQGECESNPAFMQSGCPLACHTCDLLEIEIRCPLDYEALNKKNVWKEAGDVEKMFNNIMNNPEYAKYEPKILSKPQRQIISDQVSPDDKCSLWIVSFENFLSEKEIDRFLVHAAAEGYARSMLIDLSRLSSGDHEGIEDPERTSENSWCNEICQDDPVIMDVMDRIANVTGIPRENQAIFQLLKYEVGQFCLSHTDSAPFREDGPRIATLFMYLNDVISGGETSFPKLGDFKVIPKKGKAILFPAVKNSNPMEEDLCSEHESLPVIEGAKYAASIFIHMRDFQNIDDCDPLPENEE